MAISFGIYQPFGYLTDNPQITDVVFCYDNDYTATNDKGELTNHGQEGIKVVAQTLRAKGFTQKLKKIIPSLPYKDFNEELVDLRKAQKLERSYQSSYNNDIAMEA